MSFPLFWKIVISLISMLEGLSAIYSESPRKVRANGAIFVEIGRKIENFQFSSIWEKSNFERSNYGIGFLTIPLDFLGSETYTLPIWSMWHEGYSGCNTLKNDQKRKKGELFSNFLDTQFGRDPISELAF